MANKAKHGGRKAKRATRPQSARRPSVERLELRELFAANLYPVATPPTPVGIVEIEPNNTFATAQVITLGTQTGQVRGINMTGAVSAGDPVTAPDTDYFALQLTAGDILDVSVTGAAAGLDLLDAQGRIVMGSNQARADSPTNNKSPLQDTGNALLQLVVPETGKYVLRVSSDYISGVTPIIPPQTGPYTASMRVYRPLIESAPIGTMQTLYLDFDGEIMPRNLIPFGTTGTGRLRGIADFMNLFNINPANENRLIDTIVATVKENFADLGTAGFNGNYAATGTPGSFGINVVDSRSGDVWGQDYVSRVIVGGFIEDLSDPATDAGGFFGIAQSIDVGNFDMEETALVFFNQFFPIAGIPFTIDPGTDLVTVLGRWMGNVVSHEASHFFGLRHTDNTNTTYSLIDAGGTIPTILRGRIGVGVDGIFGTADDDDPDFRKDFLGENGQTNIDPYFGYQDSPRVLANTLGSGKVGGAITGRVFNDTNRNGTSNAGETGLAGVTVFVDRDGDGILDTGEFSAITGTDGAYSLPAVVGTYTLTYVMPAGYQTSGVRTRSVTVASGASVSGQDFPIANLLTRTGTVFADVNGNRVRDNGEAGLERVLVYVDLNGDDKPGLSEPQTLSGTDGAYTLVFPGNGTYTVREVVPNGYVLTTPVSGEHTVTVTNNTTSANFDFGNRPARDYGDLPDSYGIASHGIVAGLTIGTLIDEDTASQFSATANGDDQVAFPAIDDEDGVQLLTPLAKGATATLRVTTTNSSSISAGLFAWADVNGNGTFENSELFINNVTLGTGTRDFPLAIPTNAPNVINTRFRYGYPVNQGPTGDVSSGEVEDHQFIVQATGDVAEDDTYTVSVNSTAVTLNVLANDFDLVQAPLTIQQIGTVGTSGVVEIAPDRRSILFTPAPGFRGQTTFTYVVNGSLVNNLPLAQRTATVTVNVAFQSATGIAVDDSFDVAENTSNLPLDVLKNDVSGLTGNLTVVSTVNRGQGTVTVAPGGQAVIYSAPFGITGTEQFDYIISDAVGNTARATVTVHLLPGDRADDLVEFNIVPKKPGTDDILTTVQQGQAFDLEVYVRDTRSASIVPGVGSAYLDLLYPASLVSTVVTNAANRFGADISFVDFNQVTTGDARVPGIINEVGGTQDLPPTTESRPVTNSRPGTLLFRVRMVADQPGVAEFIGDPAENVISDTTLISPVNELTVQQLRFNRTKLTIVPSGTDFAFAKDDNFLTPISNVGVQSLDVLANDNPGPSGEIQIIQVTAAANGNVQIDTKGTSNPADDVILYSAIQNFNGTDQFTYTIQSLSGELSTATVTVQVGTNTQADDDVLMQVAVTDINGNDITSINVGETFKVRVSVKDLRTTPIPSVINDRRGVFAAYMDVLFNQKLAEVSTTKATADRNAGLQTDEAIRGFDVDFINPYSSGINSGDIFIPGVINDIGATQTSNGAGNPTGTDLLAVFEVTMRAKAAGPLSFVLDPASENPPFTDTLLFEPVNPVAISRIRYTADSITVVAPAPEFMNPTNRFDVNNDGDISPVDALMVINSLNLGGPRTFGSGEASSSNGDTKRFVDVNGDNRLTPIDALSVINQLNRQVGQAVSGESGSKQVSTPISRDGNTSGSSGSDESTGSNSNSSGSTGSSSALLPASTNSSSTNGDQDDDEDFFSDLASDVSQAWAK